MSAIDSAWFYCPKINLQVDLKAKLKRPKKGLKSFQNVEYLNIQTKLGTDFHMPMIWRGAGRRGVAIRRKISAVRPGVPISLCYQVEVFGISDYLR